jgi:ribonuclease T1
VAAVRSRRTVAIVVAVALVALIAVVFFATRSAGHGADATSSVGSKTSGSVVVPATLTPLSAAPIPTSLAARYPAATQPAVTSSNARTTVASRQSSRTTTATITSPITTPSGVDTIVASALPSQARDTLALIAAGGPYPYKQDGVVWENREGRLPKQKRGYYHEYTVVTPGSPDRGARRIITGADGAHYYTADHYGSFKLVIDQ